ncbi:ABC transporter permease subunit [Bradyrhizobium sp.]|uniref:branched-chain amino acid ABC transporter ATP-binding protein/permease n=1 Tax=Bradyrhizobium sp. TaxID=376 RepID=UPI0039E4FDEB
MKFVRIHGLAILAGAVGILFVELAPNAYYVRIIFMAGIYFLCAAGMNVLVGYAGQKSLGQAGLFAVGAYSVALLTTSFAWNPWLALTAATVLSGCFGVLIALPSLRVKGPYLAMVTLAFGLVIERVVTEHTETFGGPQGIYAIKPLTLSSVPLTKVQLAIFVIALCVVTHILLKNLVSGRFGRAFYSLQIDEIAAASAGIRIYRYKVLAFVIAAVTCGLAGGLVAHETQYINSEYFSFRLSIFILLLVLFGGPGLTYGPILGAVILVALDAGLARWPSLQQFVYGSLLLFSLYLMPGGVGGMIQTFFERHRARRGMPSGSSPPTMNSLPRFRSDRSADQELLTIRNLSKAYGGVRPAQDVSLNLKSGHIHALIGPNGAGKSTLINMTTGIVRSDVGTISFLGERIDGASPAEICDLGIARTFQNLRLFANLSVLDNVMVGAHCRMGNGFWVSLFGLPKARREEDKARTDAENLLRSLGLADFCDRPATSLPYGLQRRVELARSLASRPSLLLLDEPAAGLNPAETRELGELLVGIARTGITILMVEHHMDLVMSVSDHVAVLDYGKKIAEGEPRLIQADPAVIAAYLGVTEDAKVDEETSMGAA